MKAGFKPVIYATQAEVDAGLADGAAGTDIIVIDSDGVPTDVQYTGTSGAPGASSGASASRGTVSTSTFPTTGGTGSSGELEPGNYWTLTTDILFTATSTNKIEDQTSGDFQGYGFDELIVVSNSGTVVNWAIIAKEVGYVPEDEANKFVSSGDWDSLTDVALDIKYPTMKSVDSRRDEFTSDATPLMDGTADAGASASLSREDHVHPTDTSRAPIASPTFTGTVSGITATMVGLGNVDNTSDANKPVSTAQNTAINAKVADEINDGTTTIAPSQNAVFDALALKAPLASPTFTGTVSGITATMVGLGNVDNTSDANKPVSTAQDTAINAKVADAINDGITTVAPSQNAVFDALALKSPAVSPTFTGTVAVASGASQVIGGTTPDASAILDIQSTTKGFKLPVQTSTQRDAISSPAEGLTIYNSTTGAINYYNGSAWKALLGV